MHLIHHQGDLFDCPYWVPIVHCVSYDGKMGAGIAKTVQSIFNVRSEFLATEREVGGLVAVWRSHRFIVNLITKLRYWHLPTLDSLQSSLRALRSFVVDNNIGVLAMPEIAAGLDKIHLNLVIESLYQVFQDLDIEIHMYHL
ncbi:ADP-ribose glycohydrolase OARD1-like [Thrips palmi]|uniref:ADP-ribose glycohydrolase OARD1-like n=1 Tax=Thrips palmi TaxID=161013 RepID=A0A6P8Y663_THRPL|nr:ADP-ribose glycohydrolase OARD1-like [Thrips palmi]